MSNFEPSLDKEALDSAFTQIHYYINMPKHIKGMAIDLKSIANIRGNSTPAHVAYGATTVIMGKLNIPDLTHVPQFMNRAFHNFS